MPSSSRSPTSWNPTSWDSPSTRPSPSNFGSINSTSVDEQAVLDDGDDAPLLGSQRQDRRRSSVTGRLSAMADIGGVNSFRSFARSWQRAAGFTEVIPRRPSFVYAPDQPHTSDQNLSPSFPIQVDRPEGGEPGDISYSRSIVDSRAAGPQTSLLRQHLEASPPDSQPVPHPHARHGEGSLSPRRAASGTSDFRERESKALDAEIAAGTPSTTQHHRSPSSMTSIFAVPPHLAAPSIIGSYGSYRGSAYGTISGGSLRHRVSSGAVSDHDVPGGEEEGVDSEDEEEDAAHGEHAPILVKEIKSGSKTILTVQGQSTLPQSIFNSINALIGVGLLSLPLAFKLSGWIFGLLILTITAAVTAYTGELLARCMAYDPSLITYSDLAYVSFGTRARVVVSMLFSLELIAACVALVILFADSLDLLVPGIMSVNAWKCVCAVLVLILNALPLRWLSFTSVIGIFSTFCIVVIVIVDGLLKDHTPGSLREPATTYLLPSNWLALPLAYGLLASPWGAHSVFPSIYRDMRHPYKWKSAVKVTFSFSYVLDTCLAIIGILMFGDGISDAITSDILKTSGYPEALTVLMCIFIAIIPLTKIPLNARPIITTVDVLCGVHQHQHHSHEHEHEPHPENTHASRRKALLTTLARLAIRASIVLVLLIISIAFPAFDSVCAFLGAALCTLISIILPISFYLKLYWRDVRWREKVLLWVLLGVFSVLGSVGTVWTFLPKSLVGA